LKLVIHPSYIIKFQGTESACYSDLINTFYLSVFYNSTSALFSAFV
jgi:hypothetical protein